MKLTHARIVRALLMVLAVLDVVTWSTLAKPPLSFFGSLISSYLLGMAMAIGVIFYQSIRRRPASDPTRTKWTRFFYWITHCIRAKHLWSYRTIILSSGNPTRSCDVCGRCEMRHWAIDWWSPITIVSTDQRGETVTKRTSRRLVSAPASATPTRQQGVVIQEERPQERVDAS